MFFLPLSRNFKKSCLCKQNMTGGNSQILDILKALCFILCYWKIWRSDSSIRRKGSMFTYKA